MKYILLILISSYAMSQDLEKISCDIATHNLEALANFTDSTQEVIEYLDEKSKNKYDYRCDLSSLDSKDEYIIAIDGSNSYTPIEFELSRLNAIKTAEDVSVLSDLRHKNWRLNEVIEKEQNRKSFSPMTQLLLKSETKLNSNQEALYFSHANPHMAFRCIKDIKSKKPIIKIKIIAYSWGGNSAQKVMNKLERKNIEVDSALLIDPVRKGFLATGVIKNITGTKDSSFFKKNSNVKKLTTIYQKSNTNVMAFIAIRGNPAQGADKNINLSQKCSSVIGNFTLSHLSLGFCQETRDEFRDFILN